MIQVNFVFLLYNRHPSSRRSILAEGFPTFMSLKTN